MNTITLFLEDVAGRPPRFSPSEIEQRKQFYSDVLIEKGFGIFEKDEMSILQFLATGQLTSEEAQELLRSNGT